MQEKKIIRKAKSFKHLDKILNSLIKNKKSKLAGSVFEHLTKLYLEVSSEYKTKLKKVYLLNEVPISLKNKLNLPNSDEGIDLIAETFDEQYWAIQCKYRSKKNETLRVKGDLATFNNLAFTVCRHISHGIVCSTINRPPKKTKLLKVGYILLNEWLALDKDKGELFKEIKAKSVGQFKKPKKFTPRPHQKKAISKTLFYLKDKDRGKIIMPCGTGKSLTAFWIAKNLQAKSILIAIPSLALLQQTLRVWTRQTLIHNIKTDWLCVCSDNSVKEDQDDFITLPSDLGIKVDTDPSIIKKFLKKKTNKLKILFTTYQSGKATAKGSRGFTFDLGIMDEAHKTVGSKSKNMAHLLHQKNIKINKRIFMTATERIFRKNSDQFVSMDSQNIYGDLIYELSFKDAINSKPPIISDYKIITFGISNPEIEAITKDNKYLEVKKNLNDISARELATAIALRKAIKKLKIKNAVSFHRSIKRAENFRKQQDLISKIYPTYGELKTYNVRGNMPSSERALEMSSFEEEKGLMTNARCLTEGIDLPAIDCVCFTDPKRSKVDIVQAAGRALRLSKGKKFGYILIPIFIPDGMDFEDSAQEFGFEDVSITVKALATSDKRIIEYLRSISEGKKPNGGSPVDGIVSYKSLYKVDAEKFNKAVQLIVWDKLASGNWRSYDDAKKFIKKFKIDNVKKYNKEIKKINLPIDIPRSPQTSYKNKGWVSWGDYLGNKNVALQKKIFLSYDEAKKIVHSLNYKSASTWRKEAKKGMTPIKIPKDPADTYKKQGSWVSWGDFLGNNKISTNLKKYLSYHDAKKEMKRLNIKNWNDFKNAKKNNLIKNIYSSAKYYDDWISSGDFFGTGRVANQKINFLNFKEAKIFVKQFNLKTVTDFYKAKKEKKILNEVPYHADQHYKDKWKGWKDFLGAEKNDSKIITLNKKEDWSQFIKTGNLPKDIPKDPRNVYKKDGFSWGDFLDTGTIANQKRDFLNYNLAKKFASSLNLYFKKDWDKYVKNNVIPINIPLTPQNVYKNFRWGDFLGTGRVANRFKKYKSYKDAKKFAKSLKLKNFTEWKKVKLPNDIPRNFHQTYENEFEGWGVVLGTGNSRFGNFLNYNEAKKIIKKMKFTYKKDYLDWWRKTPNKKRLPGDPQKHYLKKGSWLGWSDFLGN